MASFHTADAARPAARAVEVTPSDSTVLEVTRGLYIGTSGDVAVILAEDTAVTTFVNVANGTILPLQVKKVMAATSATSVLALY